MNYGQRLKSLRESKDLSQQELADRLKINRSTYARYELGQTQPDFDTLQKLADYFDVSTDYILGRTDVRNPGKKPEGRFFYDLENASKEDVDKLEEYFRFLQEQRKKRQQQNKGDQ